VHWPASAPGRSATPVVRADLPDLASAADLRARVGELRRMDDLIGGVELVQMVHRELRAAMVAAPRPAKNSRSAKERFVAVAELAQLAGWVDADAGAPLSTLAVHHTALRAAMAAGDLPLAGHVVGCVAQLTAEGGDPRAALSLARNAAERAAPTASATARALQWQRIAFAAARAGERRTCEEALLAAEHSFGRRDPDRDPAFLYWFDEAHLTATAGRCYSALGRPRLARPLLVAALDGGSLRFRAWAITAAALARAHADAGDLDAAGPLAEEALQACVRAGSVRATRHVRAVEPHLRAAPRRAYLERFAVLRPFLPAPVRRAAEPGRADFERPG
jgi:hypothetical protein